MADEAKADGITLKILSSLRNHTYQSGIWNPRYDELKLKGLTDL
jgi:hypothetical protein